MYGITTQGIPASEIADMGVSELKNVLQQGEIPIGATINRFLVENGFNPLYGHIESDSDGAVPIASMTGLGLFPSALTDLGNIDHESYYHNPDNARFTARTTFEALGFGTNPLYDPPEIVFENPLEDEPLETAQNGDVIIEGKLDWKGPRKLDGSGVKDIQLFKYTYENEFENGFDWEGMEVEVGDASWSIDSEGNFSVFCNIPEAEKVYALRAVIVFRDDTEMHGAVMLGSPEEFELKAEGETVLWSVEGLERIFSVDGELYVYGQPKEGEMPAVGISASINPVFTGENKIHKIAVSKYNEGGGEPVEWDENEVIWPIGAEEPPLELAQMDVSLSTFYESRNAFSVYYIVSGYFDDNTVYRFMYVFLMPADRREASDLLPPHFRPQELPDEEE